MPRKVHRFDSDGSCTNDQSLLTNGGSGSTTIRAAVGDAYPPRVQNYLDDVKAIQNALNRFAPNEGGPIEKLVPDGLCGPKTRGAIHHFQRKWELFPAGSKFSDGIVDVNGKTIQRLNAGAGRPIDLPTEFATRMPEVIRVISAARAALSVARQYLSRPQGLGGLGAFADIGKTEYGWLDKHFKVSKKASPLARLNEIDNIFFGMQTAIGYVPQGIVLATEEPAGTAVGTYMFTFSGGYHIRAADQTWNGNHVGTIYMCPKSRTLSQTGFAYAMVHELAHFVGPTENGIDDQAYFHKEAFKYKNLTPDLAFLNADCYSQFAFEAIHKPDFSILTG